VPEQLEAQVVHGALPHPRREQRLREAQARARTENEQVQNAKERQAPERLVAAELR